MALQAKRDSGRHKRGGAKASPSPKSWPFLMKLSDPRESKGKKPLPTLKVLFKVDYKTRTTGAKTNPRVVSKVESPVRRSPRFFKAVTTPSAFKEVEATLD